MTKVSQPVRIAAAQVSLSRDLQSWGLVKEPVSTPVASVRGHSPLGLRSGLNVGIWECTPGKWRRQVMQAEFAHFVAGHAWFHPDGGESFEIRAGDAVYFFPNTTGTWEVTETLRKTYVVIAAPRLRARLLGALPKPLRRAVRSTTTLIATARTALRRTTHRKPAGATLGM